MVADLRGQLASRILWDGSATAGSSEADFFIYDTVNASLGLDTPTTFDPSALPAGRARTQRGSRLSRQRPRAPRRAAEWRDERFTIGLGDEPSSQIGPYAPQGFSAGSNGFPGFSPIAAGAWNGANTALYGDLKGTGPRRRVVPRSLGGALRLEDFEDFSTTTNGRLSGRLRLSGPPGPGPAARGPGKRSVVPVSGVAAVGARHCRTATDPVRAPFLRRRHRPVPAVDNASVRLARSHVHTRFAERLPARPDEDPSSAILTSW